MMKLFPPTSSKKTRQRCPCCMDFGISILQEAFNRRYVFFFWPWDYWVTASLWRGLKPFACELSFQHRWGWSYLTRHWQWVQWTATDCMVPASTTGLRRSLLVAQKLLPSLRSQIWRPTATSQFPSHTTEQRQFTKSLSGVSAPLLAMSADSAQLAVRLPVHAFVVHFPVSTSFVFLLPVTYFTVSIP